MECKVIRKVIARGWWLDYSFETVDIWTGALGGDVLMLGNVAGGWRGWLLNEAVPETEHHGCVLHTADFALCTV